MCAVCVVLIQLYTVAWNGFVNVCYCVEHFRFKDVISIIIIVIIISHGDRPRSLSFSLQFDDTSVAHNKKCTLCAIKNQRMSSLNNTHTQYPLCARVSARRRPPPPLCAHAYAQHYHQLPACSAHAHNPSCAPPRSTHSHLYNITSTPTHVPPFSLSLHFVALRSALTLATAHPYDRPSLPPHSHPIAHNDGELFCFPSSSHVYETTQYAACQRGRYAMRLRWLSVCQSQLLSPDGQHGALLLPMGCLGLPTSMRNSYIIHLLNFCRVNCHTSVFIAFKCEPL